MNRKIFILILVTFLSIFSNSGRVFAAVSISVEAKPYSAIVKISGANVSQNITIYVSNDSNLNKESYFGSKSVLTDDFGQASAEFILSPNKSYKAYTDLTETVYESFTTPRESTSTSAQAAISSFGPSSGAVGTDITIIGTNINKYTSVTLGGVPVTPKTNFNGMMTITVPSNGKSGKIVIKTQNNGTATSSSDFIVTNKSIQIDADPTNTATTTNTTPLVTPSFNDGIVPKCNVSGSAIDPETNQYVVACDFNYFMLLINNIIKFLLFTIATPFLALIIIYVAYLYLTSGGANQTEKAKHILFNVVIGYVIALGAWLIINTIINTLGVDPSINTFMEKIDK